MPLTRLTNQQIISSYDFVIVIVCIISFIHKAFMKKLKYHRCYTYDAIDWAYKARGGVPSPPPSVVYDVYAKLKELVLNRFSPPLPLLQI